MISLPSRITMMDIAAAAGVARSTGSKALRNDSRLSTSRCLQIQRIASELGYRPHPMVSALMSQIHRPRRSIDPCSLAWIDFWSSELPADTAVFLHELLQGAQARAKQLCYQIDVHRIGGTHLSPRRLQTILRARMQWGLVIPPVPDSHRDLELEIDDLSCVTIGTSLRSPVLHSVSTDYFQGGQIAFNRAIAQGSQNVGLLLSPSANARNNGKWLAAFLERQQALTPESPIPALLANPNETERVTNWLCRYQPDTVLVAEPTLAEISRDAICSPAQFIWLQHGPFAQDDAGLDHQPRLLGAAAVDLVVEQIHRNERGAPRIPQSRLLASRWVESLPATTRVSHLPRDRTWAESSTLSQLG